MKVNDLPGPVFLVVKWPTFLKLINGSEQGSIQNILKTFHSCVTLNIKVFYYKHDATYDTVTVVLYQFVLQLPQQAT